MRRYLNFIGNEFFEGGDGLIDVGDPATGRLTAQVAAASRDQALRAATMAAQAQQAWAQLPGAARGEALHRLADALERDAQRIGEALAAESGKSLADAAAEVRYGAEITRYHAEWGRRLEGEVIPSDSPDENLILLRAPIGVAVCLIPFNFPVYTLLRKIAPALIAGNAVVARPSNHTPCSALELAATVQSAGLPAGLINILAMRHETAAALCEHPQVGMITLTGSVEAGRKVLGYAQANIAKTSLELGGKTPAIVEADADLVRAADDIAASALNHCGQVCTSVERVYAHASVYQPLSSLLTERFHARRWGNRSRHPDAMGPLASEAARQRVHAMVERALAEGAVLAAGGIVPEGEGWFYPPTLLLECRQEMEIVREEVFGPVLCLLRHEDAEQALALANDHQFGLSSVLYTENYRTALRFANRIEAGELYINRTPADPYQGYHAGWKRSGLGGDDGKHGMLEFTQTRLVVMKH
ncbi:aldehyde dehydrogenase family protein [uncultured Aquitalea sp.]|uniref:aldehyde dehydrogenase family protein n=1 Tax=uncultured Aquitalea sp. TaxID=540272 RepID=UPI0025D9D606|nr:aldehyde dehydrogenase family protein [uncultured Aquitalea sp.]